VQKFIYIGVKERLKMMLEDPILGPHMRLPWPGKSGEPPAEELALPDDSRPKPLAPSYESSCKNLYQSVGWWKGVQMEERKDGDKEWLHNGCNIALSLNVDGVQPFTRGGCTVTPIVCMVLNLPENLRHRAEYMLLTGIMAKREPSNYNPYLKFLVDELLTLYGPGEDKGIRFKDPVTGLERTAKVKLLFTSCDYPAHAHVNRQHAATHRSGCIKCDVKVRSHKSGRVKSARACASMSAAHSHSFNCLCATDPSRLNSPPTVCASSA
jgi:hypothetical protein